MLRIPYNTLYIGKEMCVWMVISGLLSGMFAVITSSMVTMSKRIDFVRRVVIIIGVFSLIGATIVRREMLHQLLVDAVKKGDALAVTRLLDRGADINTRDYKNDEHWDDDYPPTVLMIAAGNGNTKLVKLLIERGAPVDDQDDYGFTALTQAVASGKIDTVRYLINRGAKVDITLYGDQTPLMWARSYSNSAMVELLDKASTKK